MTEEDVISILTTLDAACAPSDILSDELLRKFEAVSDLLDRHFGEYDGIRDVVEDRGLRVEERARKLMEQILYDSSYSNTTDAVNKYTPARLP